MHTHETQSRRESCVFSFSHLILILNLCIWIASECFDCVLKKLCIGMPAIVVETTSKNNKIDFKIFLMNDFIVIDNRKGKKDAYNNNNNNIEYFYCAFFIKILKSALQYCY